MIPLFCELKSGGVEHDVPVGSVLVLVILMKFHYSHWTQRRSGLEASYDWYVIRSFEQFVALTLRPF